MYLSSLSQSPELGTSYFLVRDFSETESEMLVSVKNPRERLLLWNYGCVHQLHRTIRPHRLHAVFISPKKVHFSFFFFNVLSLSSPLFENVKASYYKVYLGVLLFQKTGQNMNFSQSYLLV